MIAARRLLTVLALAALAGPVSANTSVAGRAADVFSIVRAPLSEIVPGSPNPDAPALALDLRRGKTVSRYLVPTTDDLSAESFENLVFERQTNTVYALWQGFIGIHPVVYLAGFNDGQWQAPIMVTRDAFLMKYAPSMVVTRDSATIGGAARERLVLHVLYAQEDAAGVVETLYAPITFLDGSYVGPHPIYSLNDLVADLPDQSAVISPNLQRRPSLRRGADQRSIVAAFVDGRAGGFVTVEIDSLPLQLSQVATEARGSVIIVGSRGFGARGTAERAAAVADLRARVNDSALAAGFVAEAASSFAASVATVVAEEPGSDEPAIQRAAAEARGSVIIVGVRGRDRGLERAALADFIVSSTSNVGDPLDEDRHFALTSVRGVPKTSMELENRVDVSADGLRVIASWTDGARFLRYRESEASGSWTDVEEMALSSEMTLERALVVLGSKLRD
jgi:hypothetical protein